MEFSELEEQKKGLSELSEEEEKEEEEKQEKQEGERAPYTRRETGAIVYVVRRFLIDIGEWEDDVVDVENDEEGEDDSISGGEGSTEGDAMMREFQFTSDELVAARMSLDSFSLKSSTKQGGAEEVQASPQSLIQSGRFQT